jgi:hypothetical protein
MCVLNRFAGGLLLSLFISSAYADVQITSQPISQEVPIGQPATFSVTAAGAPGETVLFQWFFNGNAINGATSATFTVASVQQMNLGTYFVRAGNLQSLKESDHVTLTATQGVASEIFTAVEVVFPTQIGGTYLLQSSTDLTNWTTTGQPIVANSVSTSMLLSSRSSSHTYYRVLQRLHNAPPDSLNGIKMVFTPSQPATTGQFSLTFTGLAGGQSGSYVAAGGLVDSGTYTYSINGNGGNLTVVSKSGATASYQLDFGLSVYTKSQFGRIIEAGGFTY